MSELEQVKAWYRNKYAIPFDKFSAHCIVAREAWQARARIAEQEKAELIERAYREGHQTGRCGGEMSDESDDWQDSEARATLDKHSARDD